jgi:hypothetical protein
MGKEEAEMMVRFSKQTGTPVQWFGKLLPWIQFPFGKRLPGEKEDDLDEMFPPEWVLEVEVPVETEEEKQKEEEVEAKEENENEKVIRFKDVMSSEDEEAEEKLLKSLVQEERDSEAPGATLCDTLLQCGKVNVPGVKRNQEEENSEGEKPNKKREKGTTKWKMKLEIDINSGKDDAEAGKGKTKAKRRRRGKGVRLRKRRMKERIGWLKQVEDARREREWMEEDEAEVKDASEVGVHIVPRCSSVIKKQADAKQMGYGTHVPKGGEVEGRSRLRGKVENWKEKARIVRKRRMEEMKEKLK